MPQKLIKAHGNWVDGDRFYDREKELEILLERFREGGHTLLTAQRRMGKTSLVREMKRRVAESGDGLALFVDLENAFNAADAVKELGIATKEFKSIWPKVKTIFSNALREVQEKIEEINVHELGVKLRSGLSAANWEQKGDEIFQALQDQEKPVLLALDETPILINRILKGDDYTLTPERRAATDKFLSWLRKMAQSYRNVRVVLSGSIGLEPVLRQAGLSADANVFPAFELRPWSFETAQGCLEALSNHYHVRLEQGVCERLCEKLGISIPHHIQAFFNHLHEDARYNERDHIGVNDVDRVFQTHMLSVRGQIELDHYEERLKLVLGKERYMLALDILTEAAVTSFLTPETVDLFSRFYGAAFDDARQIIEHIFYVLEHDGYLEQTPEGYQYVSKWLKEWWKARHENFYTPIERRMK